MQSCPAALLCPCSCTDYRCSSSPYNLNTPTISHDSFGNITVCFVISEKAPTSPPTACYGDMSNSLEKIAFRVSEWGSALPMSCVDLQAHLTGHGRPVHSSLLTFMLRTPLQAPPAPLSSPP